MTRAPCRSNWALRSSTLRTFVEESFNQVPSVYVFHIAKLHASHLR